MIDRPGPVVIERRRTPRGDIQLQRRGDEYEIIENGVFIMATWNRTSEPAMVGWALGRLGPGRRRPRPAVARSGWSVLVAGLGVGYSLRAALNDTRVGRVDVVEIEPAVIDWNHGDLAAFNGSALDDPRVVVHQADVIDWLGASGGASAYDLVVLDIDNGPDWLVFGENRRLYSPTGLSAAARVTAPGGLVLVWSATRSDRLRGDLRRAIGPVSVRVYREQGEWAERLPPTHVYLARRRVTDGPEAVD